MYLFQCEWKGHIQAQLLNYLDLTIQMRWCIAEKCTCNSQNAHVL